MPDRLRPVLLLVFVLAASAWVRIGTAVAAHERVARATRETREQVSVVRFARRLLGVRYAYGGTTPTSGFDCSGFTRFVYSHFGVTLPHSSFGQYALGRRVARARLRPGDLVFFDGLGHVGIYIGNGQFIHAPHTGTVVQIGTLAGYWSAHLDGARRVS